MQADSKNPKRKRTSVAEVTKFTAAQFSKQLEKRNKFPDRKATVAEVAKWLKTGELPARLSA